MSEEITAETIKPKISRVFMRAVDSDWAITRDGLNIALAIAGRISVESAVEGIRSEKLEYTRNVGIRDGVAIIPIEGTIFRYADFFTNYSGGCTVENLARDFKSALDNPKVFAIMFEINSPGGEVTGVSELAEMIFAARGQKPMTARVGGMMCSAALWIGTAAGDVRIDDTARIGSIGVMTAFLDNRKWMDMNGLEDLEFIASQSPHKNAKPWTDEGKKRIQSRIDALCAVFGEKVAMHRGVEVEKVWKDFGQGDVFVGQEAIAAGLADSFGSYEETIYDLARTHNPYFVDTNQGAQKTINISARVKSESVEAAETLNSGENDQNGEIMAEENKNSQAPAETTKTQEPAAAATAPVAAEPATPEQAASAPAKSTADVAELTKQLADSRASADLATKRIAALEAEATDKWIGEQIKGFAGETAANASILGSLVATHGKDGEVTKAFIENQTAIAAQINASGLFAEIGKSGAGTDNTAEAKLDKLAKERATTDSVSYEQAYNLVLSENKDLAKEVV